MVVRSAVRRSVPPEELPGFTPVPRRRPRHDGWTVERQKAFIAALADTGCVAIAARMVNMSAESAYQLRRARGAESFRRAWDAAQTLGLQPVKDEAFHRAMHGQLVPVFVAGKLMGFRRKKNDRLLMFILRHYGEDASGRKTTINYFSTRASAGAAGLAQGGEGGRRQAGRAAPRARSASAAEASATTVRTVVSGGGAAGRSRIERDDEAAAIVDAFAGVELDSEARADIRRALDSCAERRRALAEDPENDPERIFVRPGEPGGGVYLGELEPGADEDWVAYRPEGEHRWENLGEGGQAEEIDRVLAGMAERKALAAPGPDRPQPGEAPAPAKAGSKPRRRGRKRTPRPAFKWPPDG